MQQVEIGLGQYIKFVIMTNSLMTRVTENSISTIKFYRVFLKIYER